jgi:hypothetical protein
MNWNDSDIGYTFWDEMWNVESDETRKRKQRGEGISPKDSEKDDLS